MRLGQYGTAVPVTQKQRDFDVESAVADRSATTVDRTLHAILDGVGMQVQFLGRGLEAPTGAQKDSQRFAPPRRWRSRLPN